MVGPRENLLFMYCCVIKYLQIHQPLNTMDRRPHVFTKLFIRLQHVQPKQNKVAQIIVYVMQCKKSELKDRASFQRNRYK